MLPLMFRILLVYGFCLIRLQALYAQEPVLDIFKLDYRNSFKGDSSERQLKGLIAALNDSSKTVREKALDRLRETSWAGNLPDSYLQKIAAQLDNTNISLTIAAIRVLEETTAALRCLSQTDFAPANK